MRPLISVLFAAAFAFPLVAVASGKPIACNMNALNAREQGRHETLLRELRASAHVEKRADGAAMRWAGDEKTYSKVVEFIGYERRCCPFLQFELRSGGPGDPLWLILHGDEQTKAFLEEAGFFDASKDNAKP